MELSFSDVTGKSDLLRGTKKGTVFLTPYRVRPGAISAAGFLTGAHLIISVVPRSSWCSCPVIPRIAWVRPCSRII